MTLATKNGALIVKDGKVAENCNCCGCGLPPFLRLSHDIPSSDAGGSTTSTPVYCTRSIPSVLSLGDVVDHGSPATVSIKCAYTGDVNTCSLPTTFGASGNATNKVFVDLPAKRLFLWYQRPKFSFADSASSGYLQSSFLYAETDSVNSSAKDGELVAVFVTRSSDAILANAYAGFGTRYDVNTTCVIPSGYEMRVYASSGPADRSYAISGTFPVYKDTSRLWWPGEEIVVDIPSRCTTVYSQSALEAGSYALSLYWSRACFPQYRFTLPGVGQYQWRIMAGMARYVPPGYVCPGCSHSWFVDVLFGNDSYSPALARYFPSACVSEWGGSLTVPCIDAPNSTQTFSSQVVVHG